MVGNVLFWAKLMSSIFINNQELKKGQFDSFKMNWFADNYNFRIISVWMCILFSTRFYSTMEVDCGGHYQSEFWNKRSDRGQHIIYLVFKVDHVSRDRISYILPKRRFYYALSKNIIKRVGHYAIFRVMSR